MNRGTITALVVGRTRGTGWRRPAALMALAACLGGCAEFLGWQADLRRGEDQSPLSVTSGMPDTREQTGRPAGPTLPTAESREGAEGPDRASYRGSDNFLAPGPPRAVVGVGNGQLAMNFENAELREVIRVILGDTLKLNYVHDPRVQGTVSLRTARPMPASAVLATLETVLRMNNGALVREGEVYKVVPASEAVRGAVVPELGDGQAPIPPGFAVRIVPLAFISAVQMSRLLEPFLPPEGLLRVDTDRNILVLAGTSREIERLLETVALFDVDWLAGRSVGIFRLQHVAAETVAKELEAVFGDTAEGPLAGLVRLMPIERLNALLVVTPRQEVLDQVETWVQRLDRGSTTGLNLYVYYLQNGKAADVARILSDVFQPRDAGAQPAAPGRVAPGREEVRIVGPEGAAPREGAPEIVRPGLQPQPPLGGRGAEPERMRAAARQRAQAQPPARAAARPRAAAAAAGAEELAFAETANIRIIADEVNNALLILATPQAYQMVEAAIRKLDIVPLQILVEATIAEVTLTDELRYGVQWFLRNAISSRNDSIAVLSTGTSSAIAPTFPGFAWLIAGTSGQPKFILEALENVTRVKVISSPHLMIRDNQTAELQVGNEVPIVTQQQQSTAAQANVINTIRYRETGVILGVTPHVNSSGSISLDIEQEVSSVQQTTAAAPTLTPTISQRRIKSSIVVQTGETIVLGGLIEERETKGTSGIPFLSSLPLVGPLFGQRTDDLNRTELLVMISPRVVRDPNDARRITDEIRRRLRTIQPRDLAPPPRELSPATREAPPTATPLPPAPPGT